MQCHEERRSTRHYQPVEQKSDENRSAWDIRDDGKPIGEKEMRWDEREREMKEMRRRDINERKRVRMETR